jgi:hypothetical protein
MLLRKARAYRWHVAEPAYPLWARADAVPPAGAGGWAAPPSTPAKGIKAGDSMREKPQSRTAWIKLRVTPAEKETIMAKAQAQSQTVTDFIRQRALDYRLRKTPLEKECVRQIARAGANLNQLARWANTYKNRAEAIQVLAALLSVEKALKRYAGPDGRGPSEQSSSMESNLFGAPPCI